MIFTEKKSKFQLPNLAEKLAAEEKFFSEPYVISYSGLNKLLDSPMKFYKHYILKEQEDTDDKYTIEGRLTHLLLLNKKAFDKEFVITPKDVPSDNPKKIIHRLFEYHLSLAGTPEQKENLEEYEEEIHMLLKEENLYQSFKDPQTRLGKISNEKGAAYWEYLNKAMGRTVIDDVTYELCSSYVDRITQNVQVMQNMGMFADSFSNIEHFNEHELVHFWEELPFGVRAFIDNLVFDHDKKVIRINDFKKTSKDILRFRESIDTWNYWLQAAIYTRLVKAIYLSKPEFSDYTIEFKFIVLDNAIQIGIYNVSEETMEEWISRSEAVLQQAAYHFRERNFDLPYEFLINGEITL